MISRFNSPQPVICAFEFKWRWQVVSPAFLIHQNIGIPWIIHDAIGVEGKHVDPWIRFGIMDENSVFCSITELFEKNACPSNGTSLLEALEWRLVEILEILSHIPVQSPVRSDLQILYQAREVDRESIHDIVDRVVCEHLFEAAIFVLMAARTARWECFLHPDLVDLEADAEGWHLGPLVLTSW